jgi:hypothetical protein
MNLMLRRGIAALELAGAAFGLGAILLGRPQVSGSFWARGLIIVVVVGFLLFLGIAGFLLWRGNPLGTRLSLIAQILQVLQVTLQAFSYHLQAPGGVNLSMSSTWDVGLTADLSVSLGLHVGRPVVSTQVAINLLALACVYILARRPSTPSLPTTGGVVVR